MPSYSQYSLVDNRPGPAQQRGLPSVPLSVQERFVKQDVQPDFINNWRQSVANPGRPLVKGWSLYDNEEQEFKNVVGNTAGRGRRQPTPGPAFIQHHNGRIAPLAAPLQAVNSVIKEEVEDDEASAYTSLQSANAVAEGHNEDPNAIVHCPCCIGNNWQHIDGVVCRICKAVYPILWFVVVIWVLRIVFYHAPYLVGGCEGKTSPLAWVKVPLEIFWAIICLRDRLGNVDDNWDQGF